MNKEQMEKKYQLLKNQAKLLEKSFGAVQIHASYVDSETTNTVFFTYGVGDWFSRYGLCKDWITKKEAQAAEEGKQDMGGEKGEIEE